MVFFPYVSYDYTLSHLYIAWALFLLYLAHGQVERSLREILIFLLCLCDCIHAAELSTVGDGWVWRSVKGRGVGNPLLRGSSLSTSISPTGSGGMMVQRLLILGLVLAAHVFACTCTVRYGACRETASTEFVAVGIVTKV
jgi:hypothetical protein